MSRRLAPMAMRMPISRVRSVTVTSMMFMMPMPPTSSEIAPMAPSTSVIAPVICDMVLITEVMSPIVKSSGSPGRIRWRSRIRLAISKATSLLTAPLATWIIAYEIEPAGSGVPSARRTVCSGTRTRSSWSLPPKALPLASSTPITSNGTPFIRITLPIGSSPCLPNSCSTTVWPITTTRAAARTSVSLMARPAAMVRSFNCRNAGVTPCATACQLALP